jgi:hypothetical protein
VIVAMGGTTGMAQTAMKDQSIEVSDPVHYARVYTGSDGETHFSDETLPFQLVDYAPPAPPISLSEVFQAENIRFLSSPSGWHGEWHPAPRRQFIVVLTGELEVQVSDGEVRRFGPGSFCLVEDITGKGHVSRVISPVRGLAAAIPLMDE